MTSIYPEVTTGPMGVDGQRDRKSENPQTAMPHLNHMWVEWVYACPRVSQLTLSLSRLGVRWRGPSSYCTAGAPCTDGLPCLLVNFTRPVFPPSPNTPTCFPPPAPRVFSAATGLLQASCWPLREETGAGLALLPWSAELGSAHGDVFTKLD